MEMGLCVDMWISPCGGVIVPGVRAKCATGVGAAETGESVALGRARSARDETVGVAETSDCDATRPGPLSQAVLVSGASVIEPSRGYDTR